MRLNEITKSEFKAKLKFGDTYIAYVGDWTNEDARRQSGYDSVSEFTEGVARAIPIAYSTFLAAVDGIHPNSKFRNPDAEISRDLDTGTYIFYDRANEMHYLFAILKE